MSSALSPEFTTSGTADDGETGKQQQVQRPPTYTAVTPMSETTPTLGYTDGGNAVQPVSSKDGGHPEQRLGDVEQAARGDGGTLMCCGRDYAFKRRSTGGLACIVVLGGLIAAALVVLGGIVFGVSVGVEKGLTGEYFWSANHSSLFRICESDSVSSKAFQVHTCNVYVPQQDLDAPPKHAFAETVRTWTSSSKLDGQARRIDPVRLDALLLARGLQCNSTTPLTAPSSHTGHAQIIVGGVGQSYLTEKSATACNYDAAGKNTQQHCARYNDGGQLALGAKKHPLSINGIMKKHFGMTCRWVA